MRLTHDTTYLRTQSGRPYHVLTDVHVVGGASRKRIALCGRTLSIDWHPGEDLVDDGSVPEPVCGTCRQVAKS